MIYLEIAILVIVIAGLLLLGLYHLLNFSVRRRLKPKYAVISKDFRVSNEWIEMPSQKPAKLHGYRQQIYLKIPEFEFDWQRDPVDIRLSDGTVVHPAIQVIDESENVYDATDGSRWGNLVGFSVKSNSKTGAYLSDDQQNVKVRIRSFEPFDCAELGWHTKWMK